MARYRKLAQGEGTAWEVKGRPGVWRAQGTIGNKRRSVTGATEYEVTVALRKLRKAHEDGAEEEGGAVPRLGAWLEEWLREHAGDMDPNTEDLKRRDVARLRPLHGMRLNELTVADVDEVFRHLAAKLSRRTLEMVRTTLRQALHVAVTKGYITRNVAGTVDGKPLVTIPKAAARTRQRRALSTEQRAALLEVAAQHTRPNDEVTVALGMLLGMRPGEVGGLRWRHVDFDAGTMEVAPDGNRKRYPDNTVRVGQPVKADSWRTLQAPPEVMELLKAHKARQARTRLRSKVEYVDHDLVMATNTGAPVDPGTHRRIVARLAQAAGIFWAPPLNPNELRHTFGTGAVDNGAALGAVSKAMGHKDLRMVTQTYGHHKTRPTVAVPVAL